SWRAWGGMSSKASILQHTGPNLTESPLSPDNGSSREVSSMLAYLFIILAVGIRLLPHPWHLTPLGAALLFFGAKRPVREWIAPLALLAATDAFLTTVRYGLHMSAEYLVTWAWYAAAMGIGYVMV